MAPAEGCDTWTLTASLIRRDAAVGAFFAKPQEKCNVSRRLLKNNQRVSAALSKCGEFEKVHFAVAASA
jgi:hypothetical protein